MKMQVCTRCLAQGHTKIVVKGSIWIELVLWLACLVPGVVYSIWRLTSKERICASCGSNDLVPLDSPRARQLLGR